MVGDERHPVDTGALPGAETQYDTRHNPFIYFHSLLDLGGCANNDVTLDELPRDLGSLKRTPGYAFIAPGVCADAAIATCPDGKGVGVTREDAFLKLLSRFAARGKVISTTYDPYSLLRAVEDLFGFTPLAHAAKGKSFVAEALLTA